MPGAVYVGHDEHDEHDIHDGHDDNLDDVCDDDWGKNKRQRE